MYISLLEIPSISLVWTMDHLPVSISCAFTSDPFTMGPIRLKDLDDIASRMYEQQTMGSHLWPHSIQLYMICRQLGASFILF